MEDIYYMKRCLELARLGADRVSPNPMAGCVIVFDDNIIGEGFHSYFGGSHAEVNAILSVKNKDLLPFSTLYVNLEPCVHFGKTPPCVDLIISHNIPKVVISNTDPFEKVSGKGIKKLRDADIEVICDIMENEGKKLNKRFFCFHKNKRPYIILKWAQSIDGFIDRDRAQDLATKNQPTWISGQYMKTIVHKWRSEEDAIIVGTKTALNDNPKLTVREFPSNKNPLRIVIDRELKLSESLHLFDDSADTLVITEKTNITNKANVEYITVNFNDDIIQQLLNILYNRNKLSLIVEGGSILLNSFIKKGLWDEARIITGNKIIGKGVKAPAIEGTIIEKYNIDSDSLVIIKNNGSILK